MNFNLIFLWSVMQVYVLFPLKFSVKVIFFMVMYRFSQWGSLFNYQDNVQGCQTQTRKYYCICKKDSNGYQEDCSHRTLIGRENYYDGFSQMTLLLHPAVKACNTKVKEPSIVLPDITKRNETYTPLPPTGPPPTFPTITGKKKPVVRQYCENRIRNSAVGKACSIIPNFPFQNYIDICVQNVKVSLRCFYRLNLD